MTSRTLFNPRAISALFVAISFGAAGAHAQSVITYHNSNDRHGAYRVPGLTLGAAASMRLDTGFNGAVDGPVFAQPLFWQPAAGTRLVVVETEQNTVYGLHAATGVVAWRTQLALPAQLSQLPCGDINPEGVTGTPVIDPANGRMYLNALIAGHGKGPRQRLYAISLADGAILPGWPIDVSSALAARGVAFDPTVQGQRGAMLVFDRHVYVAYGGKAGDCGSYHGTVVELDPAKATVTGAWITKAVRGGIWSQGGVASEGKSLFVTTGNTSGATSWGEGEAIMRLHVGLAHSSRPADYFSPANWQTLDNDDADLGGTAAVSINVPGSSGLVARMLALGKDGNAYLADRDDLGGIGGQLATVPLANAAIITAPAVYATRNDLRVAFTTTSATNACSGNALMMLDVTAIGGNVVKPVWCAALNGRGAPIITTTDGTDNGIAWVTGAEGDNLLHGFAVSNGATVYSGTTALAGLHRYSTPIFADGRMYLGADNKVLAYTFTP